MSDDRAREAEEREERPEDSDDAPQPASAAARRQRSSSRPAGTERSGIAGKDQPTRPRGATDTKAALPARLIRFLREVVSELRKVIWPTRRELVVYTVVVLVFVSFMVAFVALLDMGLGRVMLSVFG
ncbi:MAG: preprotein translocase subunit SecE [Actinomycetota bacterium]|nr:preprotein translocase subunit SecE [Actinomycetota bacterium]